MTSAAGLLEELSATGVMLSRYGDRLVLDGPATILNETLVERVGAHKAEILRAIDIWTANDRQVLFDERAAITEYDGGILREWADGFARMQLMSPPEDWPVQRWRDTINNTGHFLDDWALQAALLGWTTDDVFGVHPAAPYARIDLRGLVISLDRGRIIAITEKSATLEMPSGSRLTFYRREREGAVPVWELRSDA